MIAILPIRMAKIKRIDNKKSVSKLASWWRTIELSYTVRRGRKCKNYFEKLFDGMPGWFSG